MVILYSIVFIKVCKGTQYPFILFLITLLILSNLAACLMAFYEHKETAIVSAVPLDLPNFKSVENLRTTFAMLYYICFNVAIWCFSFRYWNISFVMPAHMSGREVSKCYK